MSHHEQPTVSVIIPTWNRANVLGRAVQSVVTQTVQDFEIIVADDSSTDNTEEVVRNFQDSRIRYLRHETNRGVSAARNTGIREAQGEFVTFLDSDDEALPDKIESQLLRFRENPAGLSNLGVVLGRRQSSKFRAKQKAKQRTGYRGYIYPLLFKDKEARIGNFPTMMVRRGCLNEICGFDEQLRASEWVDLCIRLAERYEFDTIDKFVEVHNESPGPSLWNPENRVSAIKVLIHKYNQRTPHHRYFRSHLLLYSGLFHLKEGRAKEARSEIRQAFLLHPSPEALGYLLASVAGPGPYRALISFVQTWPYSKRPTSQEPRP